VIIIFIRSVVDADPDSDHPKADPNADPDPTFHPDADLDPDPDTSLRKKAPTLEKVLKKAHIPLFPYMLMQIDADPINDPAYKF
jgi:hypothetical protein